MLDISAACLTQRGVACMTCRDACPEDAIRFRPRLGSPFVPQIDYSLCTTCGECIPTCPADAMSLVAQRENADA